MNVMCVSAVTITSGDPERLAAFYRRCLGVPLELSSHGPMKHHFEGWLGEPARGGIHFGKRIASFRDCDGNVFRLIDLGF